MSLVNRTDATCSNLLAVLVNSPTAYSNFDATLDSEGNISVGGTSGTPGFRINLAPLLNVSGSSIAAGMCYERGQRVIYRGDGRPGIDAGMDSRVCNQTMGRFRVRELTVIGTQIQTLAVDFAQSCNADGGRALFGNVRLNSAIPATTPFLEAVYDETGSLQFNAGTSGIGSAAPGGTATINNSRSLLIASRNIQQGVTLGY